jgi:uncharacterized membrane protein
MKTPTLLVLGSLTTVLLGCNGHTTPGGPGATAGETKSRIVGSADNTFTLDTPSLGTDIKQGETKTIDIGISRGKNFAQDVKLDLAGAPHGLGVKPATTDFKSSETKVAVTIEAAKDAALGEHMITVTGTPMKEGAKASAQFKVTVKKMD